MITDLMSAEAVRDPHTTARLLREHAPVVWLPEHRAWFVATYADVLAGFHHPGLSSDRLTPMEARLPEAIRTALGPTLDLLRGWMVFHDPPHHERLKDPVRRAFTPRAIEALRPFVTGVVDQCVAQVLDRARDGDQVDLIAELAFPLPAIVIAELLGVPASDRDAFKTWSSELATIVFGASTRAPRTQQAALGTAHFTEYFTELIHHYEQHPTEGRTASIRASLRVDDAYLPRREPAQPRGADTRALLQEMGYAPDAIETLLASGAAQVSAGA